MSKSLIIALLFTALPCFANAQAGNTPQRDSATVFSVRQNTFNAAGTVVANAKMNILFVGVENPLDIAIPGIPAKSISVETNNGTIKKISDGHFIALPISVGMAIITVKTDGQVASRHEFRIKRVADPVVTLNGYKPEGVVTTQTFISSTGIAVMYPNAEVEINFMVKSFRVIVQRGKEISSANATSSLFSKEIVALMALCKPGDVIRVADVIVIGPDSLPRKLADVAFTLR